jgi:2-dehydro-3-deoxyphosphogluconate aldolase/(4S)-4-hydroxy-2-oxoglutarate aldolase
MDIRDYLKLSPVVPVLTIREAADAVPLARALVQGGLKVLEVTLRTPAALEAMRRIAGEVPDAVVAAGTVVGARDLQRSAEAGARFAFSPGLADFMLEAGPIPILPGVATASEIMKAMGSGQTAFKFFPAVPAGGVGGLKALHGPFAEVAFCPTGGIDVANAGQFLALPNVLCVGGSWVAPAKAVEAGDWGTIETLARAAAALGRRTADPVGGVH